jgi:hypothetical protein
MRPVEPFLTIPSAASPVEPEARRDAASGRADSPVVRIVAAGVVWAAAASVVWYCIDAVFAL